MRSHDEKLALTILDIVKVANLLERLGGRYASKGGLSSVYQYMLLSMLSNEGDLSLKQVRENTLVTKQAITGLVERMRKGNYIETYSDAKDRRIIRVRITAKGKDTLDQIRPHRIEGNRQATSVLSEEELTHLHTIFPKLIQHIDEILTIE